MGEINGGYLEEDDNEEDEDGGEDVVDVGESGSLEGVLEGIDFVGGFD